MSLAVGTVAVIAALVSAAVGAAVVLLRRPKSYRRGQVQEFLQCVHGCQAVVHRGGTPENTLAGIRRSATRDRARGVEVDIMLSKDGECVLLHDETVDRTSNGRGSVRDLTLEQLKSLDFSGSEQVGEHIPTLEEAISLCDKLNLLVFLDIKPFKTEEDLRKLLNIFSNKPHLYKRVCIISFSITTLYRLRWMDSNLLTGLCAYCNSMMAPVMGPERTSLWADALSPLYDWLYFGALHAALLDFVGTKIVLFCKDDILRKRLLIK